MNGHCSDFKKYTVPSGRSTCKKHSSGRERQSQQSSTEEWYLIQCRDQGRKEGAIRLTDVVGYCVRKENDWVRPRQCGS